MKYPVAIDKDKVGEYSSLSKSGGGLFYDDVLEYRVWCHPHPDDPIGNDDDYHAFETYEEALQFSQSRPHTAEEPLALVKQLEWINNPEEGVFQHHTGERITEWRTEWLEENKRTEDSISDFLTENAA